MTNKYRFLFSFVMIMANMSLALHAQHRSQAFSAWISHLEKQYAVSFSYNNSLLDQLQVPNSQFNCSNLSTCLEAAAKVLPISFKVIANNQYAIIPVRSTASFKVIDAESSEAIQTIRVAVNGETAYHLLAIDKPFVIKDLFPTDLIEINTRFYQSITLSAQDLLKLKQALPLKPDTVHLDEIVIEDYLVEGVEVHLSDHKMSIKAKDLGLMAGTVDKDVFTVLTNLPGIRTPAGKPGNFNFRGSTFDQTLVYFDDIPIYHTGHFFGTISPYNTAAIDQVDVYRGILPAKWGGRVGGLVNMSTAKQPIDSLMGGLSVNTLYASAYVKTPVVKDKLDIQLFGRMNAPFDDNMPKFNALSTLNFQGTTTDEELLAANASLAESLSYFDFNGKMNYRIHPKHHASLSFINISDNYQSAITRPNRTRTEEVILNNWGITGKWDWDINDRLSVKTSFTAAEMGIRELFMVDSRQQIIDTDKYNQVEDMRFSNDWVYKFNPQTQLSVGYQLIDQTLTQNVDSLTRRFSNTVTQATTHSMHVNIQKSWALKLIANVGLHVDYYTPTSETFVDPRISLSYVLSDQLFLKAAFGRSHQYIQQKSGVDFADFKVSNEFWSLADESSEILVGTQYMLGGIYEVGEWLIDAELYDKSTDNIQIKVANQQVENGTIRSQGIDLFLKRRWKHFQSWVGYSLSHVSSQTSQSSRTAFYDQTHLISLTALVTKKRWACSLSWKYLAGLPVFIPRIDPSNPNSMGQSSLNIPYDDRFPTQHQLDFATNYKFWKKGNDWRSTIGISILNVYNQDNIINIIQDNTPVNSPYRMAIGFAPNLSWSLNF